MWCLGGSKKSSLTAGGASGVAHARNSNTKELCAGPGFGPAWVLKMSTSRDHVGFGGMPRKKLWH